MADYVVETKIMKGLLVEDGVTEKRDAIQGRERRVHSLILLPFSSHHPEGNSALITEWSRRRVRNGSEGLHQEGGGGDREERME